MSGRAGKGASSHFARPSATIALMFRPNHEKNHYPAGCADLAVLALLSGFVAGPVPARAADDSPDPDLAELDPGNAIRSNEAGMDPVRVPDRDEADEPGRPRVETILQRRQNSDAGPAEAEYPLVPGCEPVAGETGRLPAPDWSHHLSSRGLCLPAQWVDSFFADTDADFYAARTLVRVIGTSQWQQDTDRLTEVRVDARVGLPHTENRLSLIFRSDDQEDDRLEQRERILEEDADEDGEADTGVFRTAVRWAAYQTRQATSQVDLGVRGSNPFVPFARLRYRYRQPLPWEMQARANQEFYWRDNEDRRGLASELQFERPVTENSLARFTTSAESNTHLRATDVEWRWNQSLSWFWRIKRRAALQASLRMGGNTEPVIRAQSRGFSIRLRHSFWRPWLYAEVEPYVKQSRNNDFRSVHGIALRLETQLGDYK